MNIDFLLHIFVYGIIFYILSSGFKFFLKVTHSLDLSYFAIVIFSSYFSFYLNNEFGIGFFLGFFLSFLASIPLSIFIVFLSSKIEGLYFIVGTLTIYFLSIKLAKELDFFTGGVFGTTVGTQTLYSNFSLSSVYQFAIFSSILLVFVIMVLYFIRKSYFYKVLIGWGENKIALSSLGFKANIYKFFMISLTSFLASLGGILYGYYFVYIDPSSFWFSMVNLILIISFVTYRFNGISTFIFSFLLIFVYEYLRFFKIVDPSKIGYFREMIFYLLFIIICFIIFKYTKFGREI